MGITLRKIEPSDLPLLYAWENDEASWQDGGVHNPLSQKDLRDYILSSTGDIYKDGQLRLVAMKGEHAVGVADLYDFDAHNRRAAVGIYIAPASRGKGYGQEALCALLHYAFTHLQVRLLYAFVRTSNAPSMKLFRHFFTETAPIPNWTLQGEAVLFYTNHE